MAGGEKTALTNRLFSAKLQMEDTAKQNREVGRTHFLPSF
jgi:hypothetical protein